MPARTRTWSSHFYSRYITVNLRLKYVRFSGDPTDTSYLYTLPSLLSILKDFPVRQYAQAAWDTEGTSIIHCVCIFLEHSSDRLARSPSADPERGGGTGGLHPPGISQFIWVSIWNKQLDPPGKSWTPPGKCWTPTGTLKNDRFR